MADQMAPAAINAGNAGKDPKAGRLKKVHEKNEDVSTTYDKGETGLNRLEQFAEDNDLGLDWLLKPWFNWVLIGVGCLTGGFCCCCCGCMCCCKCCCNFCCGKYEPEHPDDFNPADFEESDPDTPIVIQPGPPITTSSTSNPPRPMSAPNGEQPSRPVMIVLPPPDYASIEPLIDLPPPDYGSIESTH